MEHHWVTLHRIRFAAPVFAPDASFDVPKGPICWRFCPSHTIGENNLPTWRSDIWCAMGIHASRSAAEEFYSAPQEHLGFLADAQEDWHALLVPVQHRGDVNWRGTVESNSAIAPAPEDVPGALAVITSAGYDDPANPDELPRISRFVVKVREAMDFLSDQPGNLAHGVFNGGFDGKEGFTLTLWDSDDAMLRAAYHSGHHRTLMDESRDGSLFDRSSFTRLRVQATKGNWPDCKLGRAA